ATSAVDPRWLADPEPAVRAVGIGLRRLHDALPVEDCPYRWSLAERRGDAHRRAALGRIDPARWHEDLDGLTRSDALAAIDELTEEPHDLVVCHGDACAPNTLVDEAGAFVAHVDVGRLGVGDRWADLAVATWSTVWNHGPGWEDALLDAYGIETDPDRIRAYRILWELGD
ncbi:MAG: phosphotransferase, partial [Actinomycetota bacterium]